MALTDDIPLKVTAPDYRSSTNSELEAWLRKEAEGGIQPEDNEATPKRKAVDLYEDPPGRLDGQNHDARWGEETKGDLAHNNDATFAESKKDRTGVLNAAFAKMPTNEKQDASAVSELFEHGRSGQFTTHSAPLLSKAKLASPSLSDRVKKLLGNL